jgi:hypothetical protein
MIRQTAAAVLALSLVAGGQAFAADPVPARVDSLSGKVMISSGGKLQAGKLGALKAGDRVVALAGGGAKLRYADGCVVELKAQAMATVGASSPCASGQGLVTAAGGTSAQAAAKSGLTILQWTGVGLTAIALGVGLAAASDDISLSN